MGVDSYEEQGRTAYHSGERVDQNPYHKGSAEQRAWARGWILASNIAFIEEPMDPDEQLVAARRERLLETCESPAEEAFAEAVAPYIEDIEGQVPFGQYRLDFAVRSSKVAVEIDGEEAHDGMILRIADYDRDRKLAMHGWQTLRFGGREVMYAPQKCVAQVVRVTERRRAAA